MSSVNINNQNINMEKVFDDLRNKKKKIKIIKKTIPKQILEWKGGRNGCMCLDCFKFNKLGGEKEWYDVPYIRNMYGSYEKNKTNLNCVKVNSLF